MLSNYFFVFENFSWADTIDIAIIAVAFYFIYVKVSKTRMMPILQAFLLILFFTFFASIYGLTTTHYILQNVVSLMFLAAIILFPTEIKRGLYRIGDTFFQKYMFEKNDEKMIDAVVNSVEAMAKTKTGAIIVFEGNDNLSEIIDSGVVLNAQVEEKLLLTFFDKKSLVHDGAAVISNNSIRAVSCFIPQLTATIDKKKNYGSRHLAALGLSEETDAYVVVVSEQNGKVSVVYKGEMVSGVRKGRLKKMIEQFFVDLHGGKKSEQ